MHALRRIGLIGLVLGMLGAGCDRGSSGFDISENAVIGRVLQTQRCSDASGLTLCPADQQTTVTPGTPTATAGPGPTATPLPEPTPRVDTRLANGASIACTRAQAGEPCELTFSFAGLGFPPQTVFRVAARLRAPGTVWAIAPDPMPNPTLDPAGFDAEVELDVPSDAAEPRAQFAVLAFITGVAQPPASMSELSLSGAEYAFVTAELVLEVIDLDPPATPSPTAATPEPSPTAATATATATATVALPSGGPVVTYFGVARADNFSVAPSGVDASGRPIYIRPLGSSFSLIVEGRPGTSGELVGGSAYTAPGSTLPDLQIIVERPLGDGSLAVCDRQPPEIGGVPATVPFAFADTPAAVAAINDLGCRVDDGQGNAEARNDTEACTTDRSGEFSFVDATTTAQFCLFIASSWGFSHGDTIVAARLRDAAGNLGAVREVVLRIAGNPPTPTATIPFPSATTSQTRTPTPSPDPSAPTSAASATPTPTSTRRNTSTPGTPGLGPLITHLGVARADDRPLAASATDASGRPIFEPSLGMGISIIVEAAPGPNRRQPGDRAYHPVEPPDLQLLVSRPLGNGSNAVCDDRPPLIGGVPGFDPPTFSDDPAIVDALNDFGCRVDDGQGNPFGRRASMLACTRDASAEFRFVNFASRVQYCLPIAQLWNFPLGDTIVAARVRDETDQFGETREIVVRVRR